MSDRVPQASPALVRERAGRLVAHDSARVLVLRARPSWSGDARLTVGSATVRVRPAPSQLAALDELAAFEAGDDGYLVLLTDRSEHDLGDAVLVRADRQRIEPIDEWGAVAGLFQAQRLDPALSSYGVWAAAALLDRLPPGGWPAAPAGVVTADHALGNLLAEVLDVPLPASLDDVTLLAALDVPAARASWRALALQARTGLTRWAGDALGPTATLALTAAAQHTVSVVAIGLALDVLWPLGGAATAEAQLEARGRVATAHFGGGSLSPTQARAFAGAARTLALRSAAGDDPSLPSVYAQATALLERDLAWPDGVTRSDVLPGGLTARLHALAALLDDTDAVALAERLPRIEGALRDVLAHEGADARYSEVAAARMAVRVTRRLAAQPGLDLPTHLGAALHEYVEDGAWLDRAAAVLWDGSGDELVAAAYRSLLTAVRRDRAAYDQHAAGLLAQETAAGRAPDGAVLIEHVLRDVVAPLASARPLVVLLDGMSVPVALEIVEAAVTDGWVELVRGGGRTPVLAALPTLTRWSRTAFFTGTPAAGSQATESAAVRERGGLLFHKDDLRSEGGATLAAALRAAIDDPDRGLVAVVLNTIDDALDKQDPGGTRWSVDDVQHLRALLNAAALAGRAVVLVSDHGHVVDRGSEARSYPGASTRWRPAQGAAPTEDEVLVTGPRVLDGAAILPWREDVRYGTRHSGYHGGASLAELTVPLVVLTRPSATVPAGWQFASPQAPVWWNEARLAEPAPTTRRAKRLLAGVVADVVPEPEPAPPAAPARRRPEAPGQGTLGFDVVPPSAPTPADPVGALVSAFEASEVAAGQRRRAGRRALDPALTSAALRVLLAGDGRAHRDTVASALGVSEQSFASTFSALTRLLNVEGYPVVSMDTDDVTVRLDETLLREQFDLGRG
ncbi:BREX-2 system phosphatase PglZ [Cellulomonas sp. HZM]|uniref:BREX-2 system phosphatase PglZ n=1 Tax=Cellulomonas sp. HZM TaxID=1454010 RepID=UPI00068CEB66|nr:BREX-2 system phosphatase PglZ [Cellulomonas sp. HZM]